MKLYFIPKNKKDKKRKYINVSFWSFFKMWFICYLIFVVIAMTVISRYI